MAWKRIVSEEHRGHRLGHEEGEVCPKCRSLAVDLVNATNAEHGVMRLLEFALDDALALYGMPVGMNIDKYIARLRAVVDQLPVPVTVSVLASVLKPVASRIIAHHKHEHEHEQMHEGTEYELNPMCGLQRTH